MDKAPDAYRTISEVAEDLDLPQHVLRFWETRFAQIKPLKRGGGRRYYRPDDVELLKGIRHLLYKEGYTIKGVQRILKEQGVRSVQAFARSPELDGWAVEPEPLQVVASPAPQPSVRADLPTDREAEFEIAPADLLLAPQPIDDPQPVPITIPAMTVPVAERIVPSPIPAHPSIPRGYVSMFRGGLAAREQAGPADALTEFANDLRDRVEQEMDRGATPAAMPGHPPIASRENLVHALESLVACRATIDRLLARRTGRMAP